MKGEMIDFKLCRGFDDRQTDGQTNKWTFVVVESLLKLKNWIIQRYSSCV